MKKYVVDSNIFLRTLIKEDEKSFADCTHFLNLVKRNKLVAIVPGIVLSEIVWVLKSFYKFPKRDVIRALKSIRKLSGLKLVDSYNYDGALALYEGAKAKYVDCLIATVVANKNYVVVSYDKDFDKLQIERQEPGAVNAE
jgi:predicted nucleic-acid-binding protein